MLREHVALLGGAFDPPHLGHRQVALDLLHEIEVKSVLIVPSGIPAHKGLSTSARDRLALCQKTFAGILSCEISDFEIRESERTGQPSYTFHTLEKLRGGYPKLSMVIGTDQLAGLPQWYRFPEVLAQADWIVLGRRPNGVEGAFATLQTFEGLGLVRPHERQGQTGAWDLPGGRRLWVYPTSAPALSSTEIRASLARTGNPPENSMTLEAIEYLKGQGLYGTR